MIQLRFVFNGSEGFETGNGVGVGKGHFRLGE